MKETRGIMRMLPKKKDLLRRRTFSEEGPSQKKERNDNSDIEYSLISTLIPMDNLLRCVQLSDW